MHRWDGNETLEKLRSERNYTQADDAKLLRDQLRQANERIAELRRAMTLAKENMRELIRARMSEMRCEVVATSFSGSLGPNENAMPAERDAHGRS